MSCGCGRDTALTCGDETRRAQIRAAGFNGLDYIEVGDDQRSLTVFFVGHAPQDLLPANLRITGGAQARSVAVTGLQACPQIDPERDNCLILTLDRPGDFSTYQLCLVDLPEPQRYDPRALCLDFSFKAACPSELDCKAFPTCPPEPRPAPPEIDYLAKDYASFRRLILDRLAVTMPDWTERHLPDIGITLVELLAYVGDHLSYEQDAVATEAYLDTARQRISVRRHARLVDYHLHEGCNARSFVAIETSQDIALAAAELAFLTSFRDAPDTRLSVPDWAAFANLPAGLFEVFEPMDRDAILDLRTAHNEIRLYTWGNRDCRLPKGATRATLMDGPASGPPVADTARQQPACENDVPDPDPGAGRMLHLVPGDVLIFEEIIAPRTGNPADADVTHRHPVRLTRVIETGDPLTGQPLLDIAWAPEDALPFTVCISALGPPPDCAWQDNITVLRGNVVLADHGRWGAEENLGQIPLIQTGPVCAGEGRIAALTLRPGPFEHHPINGPITFAASHVPDAPASLALVQDPRLAQPALRLRTVPGAEDGDAAPERHWIVTRDLLGSARDDQHVVAEIDDHRRAHLRFGNGEMGKAPDPLAQVLVRARIGSGPEGNVGADKLTIAVHATPISGLALRPRNPLPAIGGTAPEPLAAARLFAPYAFSRHIARAVTPADYAEIAARNPKVQRAAAELRWNGSWYEVPVAIDALGADAAGTDLLATIHADLGRYRRIGHDLGVHAAVLVPLDIALGVCVSPDHLRAHILADLRARFSAGCLPDGTLGYFHPDRLTFGAEIKLSALMAAAQSIEGVVAVEVTRLERLFDGPNGELAAGVLSLGPMEIARVDTDPGAPENGRIAFEMRGGR